MTAPLSRRSILAGLLGTAGSAAMAEPLLTSPRPLARPAIVSAPLVSATPPALRPDLTQMIASADLGGNVGFVIADALTGRPIEAAEADVPLPPASVTKALTALYALDALGDGYRFSTRLLGTGPVVDGVLTGDLVLAGGGDPTLDTDDLAALAADLAATGITEVQGEFLCWGGALPYTEEIEPGQLDHLGYNPSVSGLNLNFNRVHFEWARSGADYRVTMDARTEDRRPPVSMSRVRVSSRSLPVYVYEGPDDWTVARGALGEGGSRWLPVRRPALYAGDVFRTLAASEGLRLPAAREITQPPTGSELARHDSATLPVILRDMLNFSTNLTAEVCGLTATAARGIYAPSLAASAGAMTDWLNTRYGVETRFSDHSGLADTSRITAADMVRILSRVGPNGALRPLLKDIPMRDIEGDLIEEHPAEVEAKTGTLNFVSTLAGYVETAEGSHLAFAFFAGNLDRRAAAKATNDEIPAGSIEWNRRAKRLQQQLLQRWGLVHLWSR